MQWDDLKVLLALSRAGTLVKAARALDTSHTTLSRRIKALEASLGARLVDKQPEGTTLTSAGAELAAAAAEMEASAQAAEARVLGRDTALHGPLRLSTIDAVATYFAPILAVFCERHPGVVLEIHADNAPVSLSRREADVAIRVTDQPPPHLVGRKLGRIEYAAYIARRRLDVDPSQADLRTLPWIGPSPRARARGTERWMQENLPEVTYVAEFLSTLPIFAAAEAGMGACLLPCWMADVRPSLVRLSEVLPDMGIDLWVLTHEDLRHTARVRAFLEHIGRAASGLQDLMAGRASRELSSR